MGVDIKENTNLFIGIAILAVVGIFALLIYGHVYVSTDKNINETEYPELQKNLDTYNDGMDAVWSMMPLVVLVLIAGALILILKKLGE